MVGINDRATGAGGMNPRRNFPYNPYAMAAAGVAVVGGLWYMYNRNKHDDVTRRNGASLGKSGWSRDAHVIMLMYM